MSYDTIQIQYNDVSAIAARFRGRAELTAELSGRVMRNAQLLASGGWEGAGAAAFFDEMDGEVFPALSRLQAALSAGNEVMRQIADMLRAAEEEAARRFQGDGGAPGAGVGLGAIAGHSARNGAARPTTATPGSAAPAGRLSTSEIFSDAYMDRLAGTRFRGAGSLQLNRAMETLLDNSSPAQIEHALGQIATARGLSRAEARAQYDRYLALRAEAQRAVTHGGKDALPDISLLIHGDFLGTSASLRYGKVVGDALGIDPVFGALLNPTGGLVGPGNLAVDCGDSALSYHGAVHDAGGYLYNYHGLGPGYDYLGLEGRDTGDAFTGQEAGIRYWNDKMGAWSGLGARATETAGTAMGEWVDASEALSQDWNEVRDWFSGTFDF